MTYFSRVTEYGSAVGFASGSATPGNKVELDAIQGGVGYVVGPGINANFNALYAVYDTDGGDADGILGVAGLAYSL